MIYLIWVHYSRLLVRRKLMPTGEEPSNTATFTVSHEVYKLRV